MPSRVNVTFCNVTCSWLAGGTPIMHPGWVYTPG